MMMMMMMVQIVTLYVLGDFVRFCYPGQRSTEAGAIEVAVGMNSELLENIWSNFFILFLAFTYFRAFWIEIQDMTFAFAGQKHEMREMRPSKT